MPATRHDILKNETIDRLWASSNHGTQRNDIVAAYNAGAIAEREACAQTCEDAESCDEDDPAGTYATLIRARNDQT